MSSFVYDLHTHRIMKNIEGLARDYEMITGLRADRAYIPAQDFNALSKGGGFFAVNDIQVFPTILNYAFVTHRISKHPKDEGKYETLSCDYMFDPATQEVAYSDFIREDSKRACHEKILKELSTNFIRQRIFYLYDTKDGRLSLPVMLTRDEEKKRGATFVGQLHNYYITVKV